jgi:hypothetical protein
LRLDRYKTFKAAMHEAAFELIEIPHVRQSGKNSADIRMVVDALDLCYTKSHVDTFVVISGDSDFSPLVSKLRENDKTVIGVGVKNSTSDLLIGCCDEFIYYDDLVRERERKKPAARKSRAKAAPPAEGAPPVKKTDEDRRPGSARPRSRDARGAARGTRRRRGSVGLDGQAGAQAPQPRVQRIVLRLPLVQRAAGRRAARGSGGSSRTTTSRAATA